MEILGLLKASGVWVIDHFFVFCYMCRGRASNENDNRFSDM